MTEKEWVRLGGKDGVYLVEGEDYTVDREAGLLKINEEAWDKVPAECIKDMEDHAPKKGFLYSGGVHVDDEGCVGTFGLGAMPWPTIELKNGKPYIDGKEQEEND
jgi:hypothetical protein